MLQDKHGHSSEHKVKKTLAEKISRTLDKIASVTTSSNADSRHRSGQARGAVPPVSGGNVVWPVYAGYSPGYRTVRGPHGMSYQYVMTGWEPGLYPGHHEYHGGTGHYYPTNTFCRCPHSGAESVRSKAGGVSKCKKCSKPKTPYIPRPGGTVSGGGGKVRSRLPDTFHQQSPASVSRANTTRVPSKQFPSGPKDPYDYIRRTRLKADDWDTYWEHSDKSSDTGELPSKQSPGSSKQSRSDNKSSRHSKSPSQARNNGSQFDPRFLNNHANKPNKTDRQEKSSNHSDGRQQNLDIRMTTCDLMEDEDSNQPESKPISNSEPSVKSLNSDSRSAGSDGIFNPTKDSTPNLHGDQTEQTDRSTLDQDNQGSADTSQLSSSLLADMATMQSKISVAEMRYRKFQRRNPLRKLSLQIDDVIMEEDEEALENEELNYSSLNSGSLPPLMENEDERQSSDDEFGIGKFKHVIGDSNFADEILSEIYGATPAVSSGSRRADNAGESFEESEGEEHVGNRSLADEILDELYGATGGDIEDRQESPEYCNIDDLEPGDKQGETLEQACAENYNVAGEYVNDNIDNN